MNPLEEGEVLCPQCIGTGKAGTVKEKGKPTYFTELGTCDKCWGDGKLDWVDLIMGKPSPYRTLKGDWTLELEEDLQMLYDVDLESNILDILAQDLAESIDEEIMETISFKIERRTLK